MLEIWKPLNGYDSLYEVSNCGRIRSLDHDVIQSNGKKLYKAKYKGKILKGHINPNGYVVVHVSKDGLSNRILVHRAVAEAFCLKQVGCDIVNHIDCNPLNNEASNLEWTTYKGNMQWASELGRMKFVPENIRKAQESNKIPVIATDKKGNEFRFDSQVDAAKALGLSEGVRKHIPGCCRGDYGYKTAGGYEWKYAIEMR